MKVFIPLADGQDIQANVLRSILDQSLYCEIVPCTSPGIINSNQNVLTPENRPAKLRGEVTSRNKALDFLPLYKNIPYFAMVDRDIVFLNNFVLYFAVGKMTADPAIAAICFPKLEIDISPPPKSYLVNHVRISAMVGRTGFFLESGFRFRCNEALENKHDCICHEVKYDIEHLGRRIEYIGRVPLIKEAHYEIH